MIFIVESEEIRKIVKEEIYKLLKNNYFYIDTNFKLKEKKVQSIIDSYINIKNNLKNIEKYYFPKNIQNTAKSVKTNVIDIDLKANERYDRYIKTKRYFNFLTDIFKEYLNKIEKNGTLKNEIKCAYIKKVVMEGMQTREFINEYIPNNPNYYYKIKKEILKELTPLVYENDELDISNYSINDLENYQTSNSSNVGNIVI